MTKTELQSALAEAAQTDKRTAVVFLETLSALAYKEIKKNGEFAFSESPQNNSLPAPSTARKHKIDQSFEVMRF